MILFRNNPLNFAFYPFYDDYSFNKVVNHHGVHFLETKQKKIFISKSNKNDVRAILGPASTIDKFDQNTWIYIERILSKGKFHKLGQNVIKENNTLLNINNLCFFSHITYNISRL